MASVTANAAELATIGAGGPTVQPSTTEQALNQLADRSGVFTAVPVVASDLAAFTATTRGLTAITRAAPRLATRSTRFRSRQAG